MLDFAKIRIGDCLKRMLCGTFLWALYIRQNPDGFLMGEDAFKYLATLKCIPVDLCFITTCEQIERGTLHILLRLYYFSQ